MPCRATKLPSGRALGGRGATSFPAANRVNGVASRLGYAGPGAGQWCSIPLDARCREILQNTRQDNW